MARHTLTLSLIALTLASLEGCGFHGCEDDLERLLGNEATEPQLTRWRDPQTLELAFGAELRAPTQADPGRFRLVRTRASFERGDAYACDFESCYVAVEEPAQAIPIAVERDASDPKLLLLEFAEPVSASVCAPWPDSSGARDEGHGLELIYDGIHDDRADYPELAGEVVDEPSMVAYEHGSPLLSLGPRELVEALHACRRGGACELDELCASDTGSSGSGPTRRRPVCPESARVDQPLGWATADRPKPVMSE